jgi:putative transposase
MSNHFHVLVVVPQRAPVDDAELLRRYRVLYPQPTKYQAARLEVIEAQLATNGPLAVAWRRRQLALMGDLSPFVQLLKQRFSIWFNRNHGRFGTLWAERFKSDLIEPARHALKVTAAYIDLNCIRAGLVADPKDYSFCGYADAVAGHQRAQQGLYLVSGERNWEQVQESYRQFLFSLGTVEVEGKARIQPGQFEAVIEAGGKLPLPLALLCRNRFFSDGGGARIASLRGSTAGTLSRKDRLPTQRHRATATLVHRRVGRPLCAPRTEKEGDRVSQGLAERRRLWT